jgi:hypothetical protein
VYDGDGNLVTIEPTPEFKEMIKRQENFEILRTTLDIWLNKASEIFEGLPEN